MTKLEQTAMRFQAAQNRRDQIEAVSSACLKLEMMGLQIPAGLIECPPPANIDPLRWKAMILTFIINEGNI